ncbi:MAG: TonB family protein [Pseudomonadota bacterium]
MSEREEEGIERNGGQKARTRDRLGRLAVMLPAAGITAALCFFMGRLIQAEFTEPSAKDVRELASITPSEQVSEARRSPRSPPQRLADAMPPPPPPKLSTSKSDIDLPTPNIQGAAPAELDYDRIDELVVSPIVIDERNAQPISPPLPQFPRRMAERGVEGACEVRFNVNARGEPVDIDADCTDIGFARAAEQAVARVRFFPKIVRGQAVERRNVVYPLDFRLEG